MPVSLLTLLSVGVLLSCNLRTPSPDDTSTALTDLLRISERQLNRGLAKGLPVRDDGYSYAIDLVNTMRAAVERENRPLFDRAYAYLRKHFVQEGSEDARAGYTVLWRFRKGSPPDASGAKETGALAGALWRAYERWKQPQHRDTALKVLEAYLAHGSWEGDRFLVKNYYNYETQTLSENTWLLNQMPHTVGRVACATDDSLLARRAAGMARFTRSGYLKKGFSHEMYDRGISTVIEGADGYYSPNGILKLQSSLEVARSLLPFDTSPAKDILRFARDADHHLYSHYYFNPREQRVVPLWETLATEHWISEQALILHLAGSLRDSIEDWRLGAYVREEIVPSLRTWTAYVSFLEITGQGRPDAFYFELPLMVEAIHRYLHPDDSKGVGANDLCEEIPFGFTR